MAKGQTIKKGKTENASTTIEAQTLLEQRKQTTSQNRKAKFYDDILNIRLRELLGGDGVRTEEVANAVGIGSSAVRSWYTGYARPDMEKISAICKFFGVSAD